MKTRLIILGAILLVLSSCIKDEPLYREADIESFKIEGDGFITSSIAGNKIQVVVNENADYRELTPIISLSPGATISPASGVSQNFTDDIVYTVTSEDGVYKKEYEVHVTSKLSFKYDFEEWFMDGASWKYPALSDLSWKSANQGIATAMLGKATRYPTRDTTECVTGEKAAVLETLKGGKFLVVGEVPVFSGSLFRGSFTLKMSNPPASTLFGKLHPKESGKPVRFTGFYKYMPGETLINKEGTVPDRKDECSIYSVIYKITKGSDETLDGTNIMTSDMVVGKAILEDRTEKKNFTKFDIPFTYSENLNYDQYDYKLAVVFASSKNGDFYEGAIGSMLIIDNVEVECETIKK